MLISGKYEVEAQLGQGSMGVVYKVCHTALHTTSALKVLPMHLMGNPELVTRFYREARLMAQLSHPNIVRVMDVHHDDARKFHYLVMEYVEGSTLQEYLQAQGCLPLPEIFDITRQVAGALDYAHGYNPSVIHRDIKPTNIMIEKDTRRVVVTDFGIAKEVDVDETCITKAGTLLGTLKYCAPEQMRNDPLDSSVDIYALGMVIYELYTGAHLFAGMDEYQIVNRVLHPDEYGLSFKPPAPPAFITMVRRAIAKVPADRYRRMADLLRDLEACAATHKLAENRERRLTGRLQAQAREMREKAIREGAEQLAANLFTEGCAREEAGLAHMQDHGFSLAQKAYQEAVRLFGQAREQAIEEAVLKKSADQARQEMASAMEQADRYRAKDRAQTFYRRGLKLQAQAEELWDLGSYRDAGRLYGEARGQFEVAQQFAHRGLLEEEAHAAQNQVKAVRQQAIKSTAEELAPQAFWDAVRAEGQGDTALGQEEFTKAREIYQEASRQYDQARQHALSEHQRRRAVLLQHQANGAQQQVKGMGTGPRQLEYRQAEEMHRQGDARLETQAFGEAADAYTHASEKYRQTGQQAERKAAREIADTSRRRLAEAKAKGAPLRAWAAGAWVEADQKTTQAELAWQQQDYSRTTELSASALRAYERAGSEAEMQRREQRGIEARRQAEERKQAEQARARVQALQLQARAARWLRPQRRVQHVMLQAHRLFKQESYPEARAKFEEAVALLSSRPNAFAAVGLSRLMARPAVRYAVPLLVLLTVAYVTQRHSNPTSSTAPAPPSIVAWTPEQESQMSEGHKPRIDEISPAAGSMELLAGEVGKFSVRASDPDQGDRLSFVWSLDGRRVGEGDRWQFQAPATEASYRVSVEVTDQVGLVDQRSWRVRVKASSPISAPLTIVQASPAVESNKEFMLGIGERQIFTIQADNLGQRALSYAWFLDGKKRGEGAQFVYRPRPAEVKLRARELKAVASDGQGHSVEKVWRVHIRELGRAPEITTTSPLHTDLIALAAGGVQDFSVEASDPDNGDPLTYMWSFDGQERGRGSSRSWQLRPPYNPGMHTVEVKVLNQAGLETQRLWKVAAQASPMSGGTVVQKPTASAVAPIKPTVPGAVGELNTLVKVERATSSLARAKAWEAVEFVTEYSLTLPVGVRHMFVEVTWQLERNGKQLGEKGVAAKMAKAGAHAAYTEFTLPKNIRPGRYAVEHKVQAGNSSDVARSYFSVVSD